MENELIDPISDFQPGIFTLSPSSSFNRQTPISMNSDGVKHHRQVASFDSSDCSIQEPVTPPYINGGGPPPMMIGRFNQTPGGPGNPSSRYDRIDASADGPFSDWLQYNQTQCFSKPHPSMPPNSLIYQPPPPQQQQQYNRQQWGSIDSIPSGSFNLGSSHQYQRTFAPVAMIPSKFHGGSMFSAGMQPLTRPTADDIDSEESLLGDILHLQIHGPPSPSPPDAYYRFDDRDLASGAYDRSHGHKKSSSSTSSFLHVETNDDKFPILVRRESRHSSLGTPNSGNSSNNSGTTTTSVPPPLSHRRQSSHSILRSSTPSQNTGAESVDGSEDKSNDSGTKDVVAPTTDSNTKPSRSNRRNDDSSLYGGATLESLSDNILSLCKDQNGCRFLQRKLEENNPASVKLIFTKVYPHISELMIDPFGNYLVQKLLEFVDEEQRTVLVKHACLQLNTIALNQHGTRALQKMIQTINTKKQSQMIVNALGGKVVALMKDLNGNHVIQRCLNEFSGSGCQFIYDAVARNCTEIAKHKHGCCVFQRCIDHATMAQRTQLVGVITKNVLELVQDQFGNYVVQYVLDLGCAEHNQPLIEQFFGHICTLSVQKFSSNVIEKCLRITDGPTQTRIIEELMRSNSLERLLCDSYANYVIQTALTCAQEPVKSQLIENVRPIIPAIRSTPYGRRIQSKIGA